jgi:hypothetical protein
MKIENPKYQSIAEIEEQYNGCCILMTQCTGGKVKTNGGIVTHYAKDMATLMAETKNMEDDSLGICVYKAYTGIGERSPLVEMVNSVIHVQLIDGEADSVYIDEILNKVV